MRPVVPTSIRQQVLVALSDGQPHDVASLTGKITGAPKARTVRTQLHCFLRDGTVVRVARGRYRLSAAAE